MSTGTALVIGGTGPTGIWVVDGLIVRGWEVTILHRGLHEAPETPTRVHHLHADPYDEGSVREILAGRTFDLTLAMYGRVRRLAGLFQGRTGRFVAIGGVPAIRGWMNPWLFEPPGLPVPVTAEAPTVAEPSEDEKGYRVARTEEAVLEAHPTGTVFRYPYAYGPYQLVPREWSVVRRILDGRRRMVIPDDGLTLHHHGYTRNLAHAVLLGVDRPEAAAGQIFNCGDEEVLSLRQWIELCAGALGADLELVSMPWDLATPTRPLLTQPLPTHRVLDLAPLRHRLGYRDLVPARRAVADTARWLADHRPEPGGQEEMVLTDPFDYAAEDRLMDSWQALRDSLPAVEFAVAPGWGLAYSGPEGRPRTQKEYVP
jgi:nucleoside-diphosphate-sugar epimerase